MTHISLRRFLLVSVAAMIALVTAIASFGSPVASGAQSGQRVIRVLSKTAKERVSVDKAPKGPSEGDVLVGSSILRNAVAQFGKGKGVVVGHDQYRAVYVSQNTSTIRVTVTLPRGTITCRGKLFQDRSRQSLRATGGTGTFAGASGRCDATPAPSNPYGANALNVYLLKIP